MSLAPYFAPWAFGLGAMALVSGGLFWLAYHDRLRRLLRSFLLSGGIACWVAYAAGYQSLMVAGPGHGALLGPAWAPWVLWLVLGVYLGLRLVPASRARPTLLLAIMVLAWAWVIGAGFDYIRDMEADREVLQQSPDALLVQRAENLMPLHRALLLTRLEENFREPVAQLLALQQAGKPIDVAQAGIARLEIFPILLRQFELDLAKLYTYQWMQLVLLAVALLLWGFGRMPESEGP